jgi:hypothetical protein
MAQVQNECQWKNRNFVQKIQLFEASGLQFTGTDLQVV